MNPRISVIVPVFNTPIPLLDACIDSARFQDYPNYEIVLVDDGSDGATAGHLDSFSGEAIRVVHKENGGLSDARNCGVRNCGGSYVYFLDSDDSFASAGSLSRLAGMLDADDVDMVVGEYHFRGSRAFDTAARSGPDWLACCLADGNVSFSAADQLLSTALLERMDHLFVEGLVHEDEEFTPRALMQARRVVGVADEKTYDRVVREGSITTSADREGVYGRCRGKLLVARRALEDDLFSGDREIRRLMDERAFGFVFMALRAWADGLRSSQYETELADLVRAIDLSRCRCSFRSKAAFRNWACATLVKLFGVGRFVSALGAVDRINGHER